MNKTINILIPIILLTAIGCIFDDEDNQAFTVQFKI